MRFAGANKPFPKVVGTLVAVLLAVGSVVVLSTQVGGVYLGPTFVILAALSLWAGTGAGLAATALTALWLFARGTTDPSAAFRLLIFALSGAGVSFVSGAHRDTRARLLRESEAARTAQKALIESEHKARAQAVQLEAILNCVADGVVVYDRKGVTLRSTPAADEILGIPVEARQAPVGERLKHQFEILTEDGERVSSDESVSVRAALYGETVKGVVQSVRPVGGKARWLRMNAIPFFLDGVHSGAVLSMTDVTDRKMLEESLREADRRKDDFLGVLSHELRNPLSPIASAIYVLERADPTSEQCRRARAVIRRQVDHLAHIVDDLLDVTRIARGKILLKKADIDVASVALRAAEDYRELMKGRGLSFTVSASEPVFVNADPTRIAQIIGNLLQNAAKFTPSGGTVSLEVFAEDGLAAVRVRDTGSGIERSLLDHVFDPFTQGEQTLARSEGGLGLGLALVKGLVELHGGDVTATSEGPDRGSEFKVRLPAVVEPARKNEAKPVFLARPHRRVLVVDDNRDSAESLAEVLRMLGHEVLVTFDGREALAQVADFSPDMVFTDLGLPGMSGYELARRLKERFPEGMSLVAVSGYGREEDRAATAKADFQHHLVKPPSMEELTRVLSLFDEPAPEGGEKGGNKATAG